MCRGCARWSALQPSHVRFGLCDHLVGRADNRLQHAAAYSPALLRGSYASPFKRSELFVKLRLLVIIKLQLQLLFVLLLFQLLERERDPHVRSPMNCMQLLH